MTKREIQEAYDRMSPSQEAKTRMLSNILPQEKGTGKHRARPQEHKRWTTVPAMLALVCMLALGGWILGANENILPQTEATDATETTEPTETQKAEAFSHVPEAYRDILTRYQTAIEKDWRQSLWRNKGLNQYVYANAENRYALGYSLMDLNGDGVEEMLITDGYQVYEVYSIKGKKLEQTHMRTTIHLCQENLLYTVERGDRFGGVYHTIHRFGEDGIGMLNMVCQEIVFVTDDGEWYAGPNEKDAVSVTEAEAAAILESYQVQNIDVTRFCADKYQESTDRIPQGYTYILSKYETAIEENWGGEQYMEHDMSYALVNFESPEQYGYTLLDIDDNGVEELLITDGTYLYDVFTLLEDDLGPGHLISAGERLRYFLCDDGFIGYQGSGSAFNTIWQFYRLENGMDLIPVQTLTLGTDVWHAGTTEDDAVEITHEEAQRILDQHQAKEISFQCFVPEQSSSENSMTALEIYQEMLIRQSTDYPKIGNLYYALVDLDGNGVEEFLYGTKDSFGHVYTIRDARAVMLLSYGSDEGFSLCENGIILSHQTWSDEYAAYEFVSMAGGEPVQIDAIRYNVQEKRWYRDAAGNVYDLSEEDMETHIASYGKVELEMKPVSDLLK